MAAVIDRVIHGQGTPETAWQAWFAERWLRSVEAAELVPAGSRAVIVAPHPDDEILGLGGAMTSWCALGRSLRLVAVTDGGASHPESPQWTERTLAAARRAESAQGLHRLGLSNHIERRLGIHDGAIDAGTAALEAALQDELQASDVVFTTWHLDGHPDHEATGRTVARVCEERGCTLFEFPVWMWHWAAPGDERVPWQRLVRIPLSEAQQRQKTSAIEAHASQLEPDADGREAVLPPWALERMLRRFEYVFTPAHGPAA